MAFSMAMGWSDGELKMQKLLNVPDIDNPTSSMLTPQASSMLQRAPLLAIGTLDGQGRPWTALWGGTPGFSEPIGGNFVGTRTLVDSKHDPVVHALLGSSPKNMTMQPKDGGKMLSGLAIDLVTRKRMKLGGKMIAATVREVDIESEADAELPADAPKTQNQVQLVTKIEESLGNCPKYLNQYEFRPAMATPSLVSEGPSLGSEGRALIDKADMFFLSSATASDMDTNHRGGPPGFVRIISPTCIIYPEYSGNRFYQSLGNLYHNPLIGMTFPDYETGDVLYTTGTAEILVGEDAAQMMPGANLAVKINFTDTRFVAKGLTFRGERKPNGASPYNPLLRTLASEGNKASLFSSASHQTAKLVKKELLTPTIGRFTFSVSDGLAYEPGQWMALSFADELKQGYRHMDNSDPRSLNDDLVRTFTISSFPSPKQEENQEFHMTIRSLGSATDFLFKQSADSKLELPILGVGGDFVIEQGEAERKNGDHAGALLPFVASGVGLTPLLGQLPTLNLDPEKFIFIWTIRAADLDFVVDTLTRHDGLAAATTMYVTGCAEGEEADVRKKIEQLGARVETRRLAKEDLVAVGAQKWYLCAGKGFKEQVLGWLKGKEVEHEEFGF
ncbi:FMN binding [Ascochyta rabiei]|uniref:FMN binding n=1 Tax=Didymella rabiei TaxID=5454 RepID=A0A163F6A8_DIDRA|nr:FMN binding [Ascochyta rabiei]